MTNGNPAAPKKRSAANASKAAPSTAATAKQAATAKKAAADSATTKPRATKTRTPDRPAASPELTTTASARGTAPVVTDHERHALVAQAAYFRAKARGFAAGRELDDWVAAESEVDARLGKG